MARRCLNKIYIGLILVGIVGVGCSRQASDTNTPSATHSESRTDKYSLIRVISTNSVTHGLNQHEPSEEEKVVAKMRMLLETGKELAALSHARELMDSKNKSVRSSALETFQWIGRRALPEITVMVNDDDPDISAEALQAWEMAFNELDGEQRRGEAICTSVAVLKRYDDMSAILLHASEVEPHIILPLLAKLIERTDGTPLGECARETYSYINDGEVLVPMKQLK